MAISTLGLSIELSKVFRTKNRPIASGKISVMLAIIYSAVLCFLALIVLLNFNSFTIILALGSMPLAFTYPLMKRFTYWPQLFLGITFNYGLILGWTSINGQIDIAVILFYIGAIFWTLGYDTIYGYQDIKDDEIIGLKSTSIKFKGKEKKFLFICYSFLLIFFIIGGYLMKFNFAYFVFLLFPLPFGAGTVNAFSADLDLVFVAVDLVATWLISGRAN